MSYDIVTHVHGGRIEVDSDEPDLEALMRQKFRRRIRSGEFDFYFARNGFEALEQLGTVEGIEIVLTDINMPEFVMAFYGILDLDSKTLVYANGGHLTPYRVGSSGAVVPLALTKGVALGVIEGIEYRQDQVILEPGDTVLLYTDGVTEATDAASDLFTEQRLADLLHGKETLDPKALVEVLVEEVRAFTGTAPLAEDVTVLAVRVA